MKQLPLFDKSELQPIKQYLHVWTEVERNKKAQELMRPSLQVQTHTDDQSRMRSTLSGQGVVP